MWPSSHLEQSARDYKNKDALTLITPLRAPSMNVVGRLVWLVVEGGGEGRGSRAALTGRVVTNKESTLAAQRC